MTESYCVPKQQIINGSPRLEGGNTKRLIPPHSSLPSTVPIQSTQLANVVIGSHSYTENSDVSAVACVPPGFYPTFFNKHDILADDEAPVIYSTRRVPHDHYRVLAQQPRPSYTDPLLDSSLIHRLRELFSYCRPWFSPIPVVVTNLL
jgi:hypothetical protein